MNLYFEPYLIFIICFINSFIATFPKVPIAIYFAALIITSLQILMAERKVAGGLLCVIAAALAVIFPEYLLCIPANLFIPVYKKTYYFGAVLFIPFMVRCFISVTPPEIGAFLLMGICIYVAFMSARKNYYEKQIKIMRDNAAEQEMALRRRNEQLVTLQNDQIYMATLKERNRIAREIHDNVGHLLSSSILQVGALNAVCRDDSMKPILTSLSGTLGSAMDSIRESVHDLHDDSVDLSDSVKKLCGEFSFCELSLTCEVGRNVPKDIKYSFISVVREALNNVIRHSNATHVSVVVKEHPGFFQLQIEDNGTGNSKDREGRTGIGLINMEDRIKAIGGIIRVDDSKGFKIFISVPRKADWEKE